MPEGDTVWRTARALQEALAGQRLTRSDVRVPQWATLDISSVVVDEAVSRGKHLLVRAGDVSLHTHLRMEGAWHVYGAGDRWARPAHAARVVLETDRRQAVGFSLGLVEVLDRSTEHEALAWLGPDLLGADWDAAEAERRLRGDPERLVFTALHDQRNLAGFGNEYVNEICFLHGLLPTRPVAAVTDLAHVVDRGRRLLVVNRDRVQRTFTGSTRRGEERWVHQRDGRPCRRCGATVQHGLLGDDPTRQRVAFWCPRCQT